MVSRLLSFRTGSQPRFRDFAPKVLSGCVYKLAHHEHRQGVLLLDEKSIRHPENVVTM